MKRNGVGLGLGLMFSQRYFQMKVKICLMLCQHCYAHTMTNVAHPIRPSVLLKLGLKLNCAPLTLNFIACLPFSLSTDLSQYFTGAIHRLIRYIFCVLCEWCQNIYISVNKSILNFRTKNIGKCILYTVI